MSSPINDSDGHDKTMVSVITEKHHKKLRCINRKCKYGDRLMEAFEMVCIFYHIDYKPHKEVCLMCLKKCLRHYKILQRKWNEGSCIMDSYFPNFDSFYVIDSSDEECDPQPSTSSDDSKVVDVAFDLYLRKNNDAIEKQLKLCSEYLTNKFEYSMSQTKLVDEYMDSLDKELNEIRASFYKPYTPVIKYEDTLEITCYDESVIKTTSKTTDTEKVINNEEITGKEGKTNNKNIRDKEDKEDIITIKSTVCSVPSDLPKIGVIQYPLFREGQLLYAQKFTLVEPWYKCKVKSMINDDYIHIVFIVNGIDKLITRKEVAYATQNHVQFEVGTRVIAKFTEPGSKVMDYFYAGVIGEPPKLLNKFRYLVFFDDGYAQYRHHKDIRLVAHKTKQVWNDVHPDSKEFIKSYLEKYPERQMLKLSTNHSVRVEYQNKWQLARVRKVDASMVKIFFTELKLSEWLYRGSIRFWNIFEKQSKSEKGIRLRQSGLAYLNKPFVEFTSVEEEPPKVEVRRLVARKSTSNKRSSKIQSDKSTAIFNNKNINFRTDNIILPKNILKNKIFTNHKCNYSCVEWTKYNYNKTKQISMLAIPLYFGFSRYLVYYFDTMVSKCVMYKTPCGLTLRNMKEMQDYLMVTNSLMTIDLFDFNSWVNPLAEYKVIEYKISWPDISMGEEFRPISCVNIINNNSPPPMEYITSRKARPGVNINIDEDFLCGCDCTDNCQDKSKCACWQMTIEGQKILPNIYKDPNIGYSYRRLPERVLTGIYECNKTCKCKSSCLNRVVQHPLSQKLQLFMTEKKGWGVRCLNDVPQGSFICIYVGSLLTETDANEGGKNYGDEYLAELDYIEVVEKIKEDYESDVAVSDQEDSDNITNNKCMDSSDDDFQSKSEDSNMVSDISLRLRKRKKPEVQNDTKTNKDNKLGHIPSKLNARDIKINPIPPKSMREYFGNNENVYIMDAKTCGNIGRYLNHSCSPNTYVQNVFVDTHDLRFPWVSFFALHYIPAGTELTWDYSYDVGSVPGKVMKCHCESMHCRGRLL